ncbi:histidine protein kinase [Agrilactobacillus composti DSM 18527 = JCM 14202]|uniref:histidine kinase n=1 Tax=Agrilactobacillus composti DSM 18527 = JCM 14202 TaxID=1423734 RepID=X0PEX3_9LACO|nr:sensor histidine kinase [Agrilactobacillus composti]KRM32566.1 histidine protein kinase [Agrilactobacillus composti DSM 18527 = JCM 14202]GAF40123.1 sensor histidine kinase [Agrilactobacillus composti DSM 18527 = JCM 14202]
MGKRFGWLHNLQWASYVWLLYLPFSIMLYLPVKSNADILWLILCGVFLVLYVLVSEVPSARRLTIPLELLLTGAFAIFTFNFYMIIFPGWQISFIIASYPRKYFHWFVGTYYALVAIALIQLGFVAPQDFAHFQIGMVGLFFPLVSPLVSYWFARSIVQRRQLQQTNRRLENLVRRGERERIARDLHDTLGQSFSMITLKAELAQKLLQKAPDKVSGELQDIAQTSRENLQLVRTIVNGLHEESIGEVLLTQAQNLAQAKVILLTQGEEAASNWPTAVQNRFGAVLTEAITNIIRHAKAHQAQIDFSETSTHYEVQILDDGQATNFVRAGSNGIKGMQARLAEVKGNFDISHNRQGTLVTLTIPKEVNS